jgi:hypothetical protein
MEAQAALVRADRHAVLDAVTTIDLHIAMVIDPGDTEHDDRSGSTSRSSRPCSA